MLGSRKFEKVILRLIGIALIFAMILVCFPNIFSWFSRESVGLEYPVKIFERDVLNIEITADENEWNEMLENKMSKPYISCDLNIDGKEFKNVGLRPKGNSSLTSIQGDRISYRLDFDHYVANQTCYGLEQMVLNNLQADATYMKDYIAYDLMEYEGVKAPLHTHAFITLNGKPFGVYLAAEVYDEDYLERTFNDNNIKLYNVKSSGLDEYEKATVDPETATVIESKGIEKASGMGGPGGPPPDMNGMPPGAPPQGGMPPQGDNNGASPQGGIPPQGDNNEASPQGGMPPQGDNNGAPPQDGIPQQGDNNGAPPQGDNNGAPPPPGGNGGGGDLVYVDDSTESYSTIFANAVSKHTDAKDYAKVIRAIKYLNKTDVTNEELEKYWDVDGILRYLAVHNFMVNGDSYTGNMKQNYFLAEQDGRISVLPWDYNLSFGAFGGGPGGDGPGGPPPGMNVNNNDTQNRDKGATKENDKDTEPKSKPDEQKMAKAEDKGAEKSIDKATSNNSTTTAINLAIDTPTIGVEMADRPLVSVLLGREEYKQKYHNYLDELTKYVTGDFIKKLEVVENSIYPYIEKETVSFYTPEEHKKGFEVLKKFLRLRSQSIQGQLEGRIPSETDKQKETDLITADFSINEMGSMGGPGGGGGPPMPGQENKDGQNQNTDNPNGNMPPQPPTGMQGENGPGGNMPPSPPGMPGQDAGQNSANGWVVTGISLLALCLAFAGVKLFKRKY